LNSVPLPRNAVISACSGEPEPFFSIYNTSSKMISRL
jgi:hypothetical protein